MPVFKSVMRWALAVLFVAAGVNHFVNPQFYLHIVPPYLPWPTELVFVSGACEVLGGVGLLLPPVRGAAAWGLIALLVAVFPANVHMALHPEEFPRFPPAVLWGRLPIQGVLIAWAYWFIRRAGSDRSVAATPPGS
jgi:uncharacterized membrane protein